MKENFFKLSYLNNVPDKQVSGVKTFLNEQALKYACAYVQHIRNRLPVLNSMEFIIHPAFCVTLLNKFYGMEPVALKGGCPEIDLYTNWKQYCLHQPFLCHEINEYAVCNASVLMLGIMRDKAITRYQRLKEIYPAHISAMIKDIEHLEAAVSGCGVASEWRWYTPTGENLTGRQFLFSEQPEIITQPAACDEPHAAEDWHPADVISAIKKSGTSLAMLSRQSGLSPNTLANALKRKWPKGERIIASHLRIHPSKIWPSRY